MCLQSCARAGWLGIAGVLAIGAASVPVAAQTTEANASTRRERPAPVIVPAPVPGGLPLFLNDRGLKELERANEAKAGALVSPAPESSSVAEAEERQRQTEDELKRNAEEMKRKAMAEAEEKRRAKKLKRAAAAAAAAAATSAPTSAPEPPAPAPRPETVAQARAPIRAGLMYAGAAGVAAPAVKPPEQGCGAPRISTLALPAGRMSIAVEDTCNPGTAVTVRYGAYQFNRKLDTAGRALVELDLFLGLRPQLSIRFANGNEHKLAIETHDLDKVSKVAIVWSAPVNLDLHAFEYAALNGEAGHVWAQAPSSMEKAVAADPKAGRGRGFMSNTDLGGGSGHKVEVYTFWHVPGQQSGTVSMAVDFQSRGSIPRGLFCGDAPSASVDYEVFLLERGATLQAEGGLIQAAACVTPISDNVRFRRDVLPELRFPR